MPSTLRLALAHSEHFSGAQQFCQRLFEQKSFEKASAYFVYVEAFSDYLGRTGKGKTVCCLVPVGLKSGL
jgi:hypothetical protein